MLQRNQDGIVKEMRKKLGMRKYEDEKQVMNHSSPQISNY